MSPQRSTDILARFVEASGTEVPVSLIVQGMKVVGMLTSATRFHRYTAGLLELDQTNGGAAIGIADTTKPPDAEESERIREAYARTYGDTEETSFTRLCVRNAEIQSGTPDTWRTHPYLLVNADHVGAFTIGYFK